MDEVTLKAKAILIKNAKTMAKELVAEVIFVALKEAAKKSETPIDDAIIAALETPLKNTAIALIDKIEE